MLNKKSIPHTSIPTPSQRGFTPTLENGIVAGASSQVSANSYVGTLRKVTFLSRPHHKDAMPFLSAGFTLIETLLAVLLLSMAIIAPLSIASNNLSAATTGKNRLIAISLARDAIEYIRHVRDTNRLVGDPWLNGLSQCIGGSGCRVDTLAGAILPAENIPLLYDNSQGGTGLYGYNIAGSNSPFFRSVKITERSLDREALITAEVSWSTTFSTKRVKVVNQLTNWEIQ